MPVSRHYFWVLLLLWGFSATAQQSTNRTVNARAELARKEIVIGDQINLTVNVSAPPGTTVFPVATTLIDGLPAAEVIRDGGLQTLAETPELLLEQRFLITSFDTGQVAIPPLPVYFETPAGRRDTVYTTDLLLTVRGAIVAAEDDILPIKPIIEEPRNLWDFWWLFALLAAAGLFFGIRAYRRRQPALAPAAPPPPPAHVRALEALDELERQQLWQAGRTDRYYVELTHILRAYLEERFGVPALEMTTRQITSALDRREELDRERAGELNELLQLSDLVKFAKATPAAELHPRSLDRVRTFIVATQPRPETEEEAVASPPKPQV
ncbi:hypothetical protein GGR26_003105 [Lewinella marina]|uniref:Protein BatD n=1 Tax=Neolewinella marina TaxID=438751 RepID=A0A2G0CEF0_9BACT|nr:hypothetical protein [Neolewinella marina]NJB87325.1 hypothetical protein [Neolewinella marina]PHK98356.1 hypothetical protein CGL56_11700 [Neolewinella marina]